MAKQTQKDRRGSKPDADRASSARGGRMASYLGALAVVLAAGGGAAVWHRRRDPARVWARGIEVKHAQRIDQPLSRCFGGVDGAAVRRAIEPVRSGTLPPALQRCRGAVLMDVMTEPLALNADLANVPAVVDPARNRERSALAHLRASLGALARAEDSLAADARTLSPDQRDALARAIEDVAVDVDAERTSFADVLAAAESGASAF